MKRIITTFGLLGALSACGGTVIPIIVGPTPPPPPVTSNEDQSFKVILNNLRMENGAGGVTYDSRLDAAAQVHADDMVDRGYFAHDADGDDNDGVDTNMVWDRVEAQGYDAAMVGENIGGGGQMATEQDMLDGWEDSPAHFNMMTTAGLEEFGLAVAGEGNDIRWVLVMATEN